MKHRALALLTLTVSVGVGCAPGRSTAEEVLQQFTTAVQAEDLDALYCLLAGAAQTDETGAEPAVQREAFDRWVHSRFRAYLDGRDRGGEPFGDDGILLVKTFALGKGTFYTVDAVTLNDGVQEVATTVRFGYGNVNYSTFSAGTTFYLAAVPVGRVVAVRVPHRPDEIDAEVLETVRVRWRLVRAAATPSCAERWAVASVDAVPGSEMTSQVSWLF